MAYIYQGDFYCDDCGEGLRDRLLREGVDPEEVDSDRLPLPVSELDEADYPVHCANCDELLGFSLTSDGVQYVVKALADYVEDFLLDEMRDLGVLDLWREKIETYALDDWQSLVVALYDRLREMEEARVR